MRSPRAQLVLQSLGFISGFIIWVLLAALLPFIKEDIPLTAAQATWVAAIPVILGSVMRIPLGYLTSLYGARLVFMGSFLFSVLPIWILARAGSFFELVLGGVFPRGGGRRFRHRRHLPSPVFSALSAGAGQRYLRNGQRGDGHHHLLRPDAGRPLGLAHHHPQHP